jgi:UPF0755 protein
LLVRFLTQSLKIISILAMTIIVVVGSVSFFNYWTDREQSEMIGRPVTVTITEEDDGGSVADKLSDADLVKYGIYFETRFRFSGDDLQPGTYTLRHGMSVAEIIDAISVPGEDETPSADAIEPSTAIRVTFIEGERIEQYAERLVEAGWEGDPQAFIDAAKNPANTDQWDFLSGIPEGAGLEGFLFPDTYEIAANESPQDVMARLLYQFDAQFDDSMRQSASEQGMSIFDVVTLASIVEREAAVEEERVTIAGLYRNRLDAGMVLQADPTRQYIVGTPDDWWPELDTELLAQAAAMESPYDTYLEELAPGLPAGPIANPGVRALQAVLQPEEHDYIYMMAKGDETGTHAFTSSLEEHEQNICTYDPEADICTGGSTDDSTVALVTIESAIDRRWLDAA